MASSSPGEGLPAGVLGSAASDTFSQIMHTAGARQTRAEIESMTDALTGLYNHRRFHELLRDTVEGARAADAEVAVLFCDIDRFKELNDRGDAATTISIGVATLADHSDAEELLASADRAMYAAKELGRDRVVRADTLETAPVQLASQL